MPVYKYKESCIREVTGLEFVVVVLVTTMMTNPHSPSSLLMGRGESRSRFGVFALKSSWPAAAHAERI